MLDLPGMALSIQSDFMDVRSKPFFSGILLPHVYMQVCIYILESPILKEGTLFKVCMCVYVYMQYIYVYTQAYTHK